MSSKDDSLIWYFVLDEKVDQNEGIDIHVLIAFPLVTILSLFWHFKNNDKEIGTSRCVGQVLCQNHDDIIVVIREVLRLVWILKMFFLPLNCNILSNGLNLNKSNVQMILKTVCALVALLLELFNSYGDGEFDWSNGYAPSLHNILD